MAMRAADVCGWRMPPAARGTVTGIPRIGQSRTVLNNGLNGDGGLAVKSRLNPNNPPSHSRQAVVFDANAKQLLSSGSDNTFRIWS